MKFYARKEEEEGEPRVQIQGDVFENRATTSMDDALIIHLAISERSLYSP